MIRAIAIGVLAFATPAAAQLRLAGAEEDVLVFRSAAQVQVVETFALEPGEAEALAAFERESRYYGALYVDPTEEDNSIYMIDIHSLAAAEALAEAGCSAYAGGGKACVLYARVVPDGDPADLRQGETLSESATEDFLNDFIANKDVGLSGVFAVSGIADWVYYLTPDSHATLTERAKTECAASAQTNVAALPPAIQSFAQVQMLTDCRVIYLRYPAE